MAEDKRRCINCGFLGKQRKDGTVSECFEATPTDRSSEQFQPYLGHISVYPRCFVRKIQFEPDWGLYNPPDLQKFRAQISEQRKCSSWYPYTEGLSPKEHFEEFKILELERKREDFEQRMEKERKEFEIKLDERNREERKRTDRIMIWLTVAALIFAMLQVYAAMATINPNHWLFNWLR